MNNDRKKYNPMEALLQKINKEFISLTEEDKKRNNEILKSLVTQVTEKMKEKDSLFASMFTGIFYGGSFYDGLKVAHPDEYDLDLLLKLPSPLKFQLKDASNVPGFVVVEFSDYTPSLQKLDLQGKHKGMDKMINSNHYLDTSKTLQWMQKVVQLALNTFEKDGNNRCILKTPYGNFYGKFSRSGPAFTLKATGTVGTKEINMDVDLVPCFLFPKERWPQGGFRKNPVAQKPNFFIVPKQNKGMPNSDHYWRLSFQEQERVLLDKKETLKPAIRLLKKMRDILQHAPIASYYIKTVALWTVDEKDPSFWNNSQSFVFLTVLKNYQKSLETGRIPYYWNKNHNLLGKVKPITLTNINNKIKAIIEDIEKRPEDPLVVAKYLVTSQQELDLKRQYGI